jgi:hypothetical protein
MDILAIVIMIIIAGIVTVAWRIRAAKDKSNIGLKVQPVLSERVEKSQMQISIEKVEKRQVEISKTLDQILEIISKENNQKAKKKKSQKTTTRKTVSRQKKKEV